MTEAPAIPHPREERRYSAPFAASLAEIDLRTVRKWLAASRAKGETLASFLDVVELRIVHRLLGTSRGRNLLRIHDEAKRRTDSPHPFASRRVLNERGLNFWLNMPDGAPVHLGKGGQTGFAAIVKCIAHEIKWDADDDLAARLIPVKRVVVDPSVRWGQPVIEGTRVTTAAIRGAWNAYDQDNAKVAVLYGLTEEQVQSAVEFEASLAYA